MSNIIRLFFLLCFSFCFVSFYEPLPVSCNLYPKDSLCLTKKDSVLQDSIETTKKQLLLLSGYKKERNYKAVGELYKKMFRSIDPQRNFEDFIKYSDSSYAYLLKSRDTVSAIFSKYTTGSILQKTGEIASSMEQHMIGLEMSQFIGNKKMVAGGFNNMAVCYLSVKNYDQAEKTLHKVMSNLESLRSVKFKQLIFLNYGELLLRQKRWDSAIYYTNEALRVAKCYNMKTRYQLNYLNLAEGYIKKGMYDLGLEYARMSGQFCPEKRNYRCVLSNILISDALFGKGDSLKGDNFLMKSYKERELIKSNYGKLQLEERMVDFFKKRGDHKSALFHKEKYHQIYSGFYDEEMTNKVQQIKIKNLFVQKEKEIDQLILERQKKAKLFKARINNIILISAIGGLLFLGGFLIYKYRSERTLAISEREQAESKLEALHSKMSPHFLFNTLSSIQNLILKSNKIEAYNVLNDFSQLLRIMLKHSGKTTIKLSEEVHFLNLYLSFYKMRYTNEFTYRIDVSEVLLEKDPCIPNMMLQPHIENALVHAFPEDFEDVPKLDLIFEEKENSIVCTVIDNGVGRKATLNSSVKPKHETLSIFSENLKKRIDFLQQLGYENAMINITDLYEGAIPSGTSVEMHLPYIKL